jgi:hypothetical protein
MYVGKEYKKGPILCVGHKNAPCFLTNKINYDDLWIGTPQQPIKAMGSFNFLLELADGEIISPSAVNLKWLESKKVDWIEKRQGKEYGQGLLTEYNIAGCSFFIMGYDLVMIRGGMINGYGGIVALWDGSKTKRYQLPLSYEDLVNLFGEPDELTPFFGK